MANPAEITAEPTTCEACEQTDDHPNHSHWVEYLDPDGRPAGKWVDYHLDCCADRGCESCREAIQGRPKGAVGDAMRAHLTRDWEN